MLASIRIHRTSPWEAPNVILRLHRCQTKQTLCSRRCSCTPPPHAGSPQSQFTLPKSLRNLASCPPRSSMDGLPDRAQFTTLSSSSFVPLQLSSVEHFADRPEFGTNSFLIRTLYHIRATAKLMRKHTTFERVSKVKKVGCLIHRYGLARNMIQ